MHDVDLTAAERDEVDATPLGGLASQRWREHSRCSDADPRIFFGDRLRQALVLCDACPVAADCLAYAIEHRIIDGVWGGTVGLERQRIIDRLDPPPALNRPARDPLEVRDACGTEKGYQTHRYHDEPRCQPCKDAHSAYVRASELRTVRRRCEHCGQQAKVGRAGALLRHVGCPVLGKEPTTRTTQSGEGTTLERRRRKRRLEREARAAQQALDLEQAL